MDFYFLLLEIIFFEKTITSLLSISVGCKVGCKVRYRYCGFFCKERVGWGRQTPTRGGKCLSNWWRAEGGLNREGGLNS